MDKRDLTWGIIDSFTTPNAIPLNEWKRVVIKREGNIISSYIDGEFQTSSTNSTSNAVSTDPIFILNYGNQPQAVFQMLEFINLLNLTHGC